MEALTFHAAIQGCRAFLSMPCIILVKGLTAADVYVDVAEEACTYDIT